jgi:hypothetical protein
MIFNHNHTTLNHQKIYDDVLPVMSNGSMDRVKAVFILGFLCCNLFSIPKDIISFIFESLLRFL